MTALPGNTMNHLLIETDLAHLEQIINRIASSHGLSLAYWRNRVDSVLSMSLMPAQRKRIGHIDAVISMLEQTALSKTSRLVWWLIDDWPMTEQGSTGRPYGLSTIGQSRLTRFEPERPATSLVEYHIH
jgi:hypothetical protein